VFSSAEYMSHSMDKRAKTIGAFGIVLARMPLSDSLSSGASQCLSLCPSPFNPSLSPGQPLNLDLCREGCQSDSDLNSDRDTFKFEP